MNFKYNLNVSMFQIFNAMKLKNSKSTFTIKKNFRLKKNNSEWDCKKWLKKNFKFIIFLNTFEIFCNSGILRCCLGSFGPWGPWIRWVHFYYCRNSVLCCSNFFGPAVDRSKFGLDFEICKKFSNIFLKVSKRCKKLIGKIIQRFVLCIECSSVRNCSLLYCCFVRWCARPKSHVAWRRWLAK